MLKRLENVGYFRELYRTAHLRVSRGECDDIVGRLGERVLRVLSTRRAVYGWSGGKDSVVLEYVLRSAGLSLEGACILTALEYPAVDRFCATELPRKVTRIRTHHNITWLLANRQFLFPTDPALKARSYAMVQQAHMDKFAMERGATVVVLGRRRADGNVIPSEFYEAKGKPWRYNPLADTSHEFVWAAIRHYNLPEYPLYAISPKHLVTGTGWWPQDDGWDTVRHTDPSVYANYYPLFANAKD